MHVFLFIGCVVAVPVVLLSALHILMYEHMNAIAISMIVFLTVNSLICIWELVLFYCFDVIEKVHQLRFKNGFYKSTSEGLVLRENEPIIVFKNLPISELLDPKTWAYVWIDYSRFDNAYTDKTSFGYNIDVANGHSTLALSLALMYSVVDPIWSPKVLGVIGVVLYYQKWYGTVIYLFQFCNNQKYKLISLKETIFCVWCSNLIWIIFPMIGFYASLRMIFEESYEVYQ